MNPTYPPPLAPLWRLSAAARLAGVHPDTLAAGIERGEVPLEIVRLGVRGDRYVRSTQFAKWLQGRDASKTAESNS